MTLFRPSRLALLAVAASVAGVAADGTFNVVSFNVAGLPEILQNNGESGDKTKNTALIGQKFADQGYDLIHVQEDFNYHATLYEYDNHAYRTATSGGAAIGSGLNSLSNYDWRDFTRVKWDECSNASGADCLTPKGFTYMRWRLAEGVYVDAYNLHADAGTEDADETARNANIAQVSAYIDSTSPDAAVLVFGDTNCRYTRTSDNIDLFSSANNLTDVWVQLELDGVRPTVEDVCANPAQSATCEVVDKIFYRPSPLVLLTPTSFAYMAELFLSDPANSSSTLSDHNPLRADFAWAASSTLRSSDFLGGPHGTAFSDIGALANLSAPPSPAGATLSLRGAERVDAVGIALADGATSFSHGGTGGTAASLVMQSGEYVNNVTLCQGKQYDHTRVFYLEASTNSGNSVSTGTLNDDCAVSVAPEGWGLVGFWGRDGDEVDLLAALWAPAS
ncbi:endonuclease/Exonuclease/phosphatase [Phyllosticta paracitricarpa]|uniref:Endonuclease/Exonuclease/phosphatase n=1 Tax=Phyllosticta paracitricarpa TaxID=2016321 RepID=A0ABR1N3N7_9PEZI